ncbi:MAG: SIMPL domain-containing protein [Nitrososphaeria archaeon]
MNREQKIVTISVMAMALILITVSLYAILGSAPTIAANTTTPPEHTLSVSGVGEVNVNPDLAKILLAAVTEAPTTTEAAANNAEIVNEFVSRLAGMGIRKDDVKTTSYSIYPVYKYPNDGSAPSIVGYRVSHSLEISIQGTDMQQLGQKAGKVIDEAVAAGVNQVSGVKFTVTEQTMKQLKNQALQLAISDASAKANLTAKALGVKIIGVQSASESSQTQPPIYYLDTAKAEAGTTLIPGQVTISSSIYVVYIIG